MNYKHRDIDITFDEQRGTFSATVAGKLVRKGSLLAMKKLIDKNAASGFVPFTALSFHYGDLSLDEVQVTGIEKSRRRHGRNLWKVEGYGTDAAVVANTPENVNRIGLYLKKKAALKKITEVKEAELEKIEESITKLSPPQVKP